MKKIANIIEESRYGGPQARIVNVAVAMKSDIATTIIMPIEGADTFRDRCVTAAVKYEMFPITRISRDWKIMLRYLLLWPIEIVSITRYLKKEEFDLVHVSGGSWQYKGVIAGKLAGKKVLWHLNDSYMPRLIRAIFTIVSRFSDGFIYASERTKEYYRPLISRGAKESVVPAPAITALFTPQGIYPGDEEFLESLDGKFVVGMVANINPIKGLADFVRAAALLNNSLDNAFFVIIGAVYPSQQQYYESLKKLCGRLNVSNIEFVGGRSDVRPLLKRFDVYVCSSNAESSPISVWEAMSMAKPIVSTDVGDVPLYLQDGANGFIVDVGDSAMLANRVGRLAGNEALRKDFGSRCRDLAIRELDVSRCAERHLEAYNAIILQ